VINKNGGSVSLLDNLEAGGTFTTNNATSLLLGNNKTVTVAGNVDLFAATYTPGATGTFVLNGSNSAQTVQPNSNQFSNFTMNKTGIATLLGNAMVNGTLTLTNGILTTGAFQTIVTSNLTTSVTGQNTNSYINGNLKRAISNTGLPKTYSFPVGDLTRYALADLNLTGLNPGTMTAITGRFNNPYTSTGAMGAGAVDGAITYINTSPEGIWQLDPDNAPTSVSYNIQLYFNDGGGTSPFTGLVDDQFAPLKRPTGSTLASAWVSNDPPTTIPAAGTAGRTVASGYAQRNGWTSFSEFAIGRANNPLPVELISFLANCGDDGKVIIKWSTASETNNSHFLVERSINAVDFVAVATVQGAGNSNSVIDYIYVDTDLPEGGKFYYRITQVDFDGTSKTSEVLLADCQKVVSPTFVVIPNPASEGSSVQIIGKYNKLHVTDLVGQSIDCEVVGDRIYNLGRGVYILTFDDLYKVKLIVQ
jgi:hypothetical protein